MTDVTLTGERPHAPAALEVGKVITRTVDALRANLVLFASFAFVFGFLPDFALEALYAALGDPTGNGAPIQLSNVVGIVPGAILQAALIRGAATYLQGGAPSRKAMFATGVGELWQVVGVSMLTGIGILVGTLLLIAPGLFLATRWAVAVPAKVLKPAADGAIERSTMLTKGSQWKILALLALFGVGALGVFVALGAVTGLLPYGVMITNLLAIPLAQGGVSMVAAVGGTVLYEELRTLKEGPPTSILAEVFD